MIETGGLDVDPCAVQVAAFGPTDITFFVSEWARTRIYSGFFPLFYSVSVACQDDLLLIRQRWDALAKDEHVARLENRLN
jgi:hypothetical protein